MAVGSLEPQFYTGLLQGLCLTEDDLPHQGDFDKLKSKLGLIFATKTRDEWTAIFDNIDACVTPVLELDEAKVFPHSMERGAFAKSDKGELDPVS
jgi:alpha-methylacyl-CoA racemase